MLPVRRVVVLSQGTVTLFAWGADVADGHLHDLLIFTSTLGELRDDWGAMETSDVEPRVWSGFWRLVRASLRGQELPETNWNDRIALAAAMWELNDLEAAQGKLTALIERADRRSLRLYQMQLEQGHKTTP
ncbi:hypothetical protein [Deinococcus soli (ex Cha et al. 2016)]|uniref:Uncharacterized protein n=1 Tax=Deinococcus soli (ex Cha et al. 2016) TaxID=1309411 RepID=A0ACC6KLV9_9DEIO|nr:hypothetical protein [Deinococcus soli (ex Cha et al. 2016)]MDR6753422.1 hypothetical protein [Deinococcus soli (ex Cha et al. 2016)]